ncbi:hypothetical protein LTR66_012083 [Elasticomyces elasticus]|nr:hypothetical protein LTR66_012083 [Elasticomyces elasticus]
MSLTNGILHPTPTTAEERPRVPITVITGFVGSGKTTLILNLLPQLRKSNPNYKLALIKNEIGDNNIDTQLAEAAEMTGTRELLGACICCTNVGQIGHALAELDEEVRPDRIVIETSGSAEPIKLVVELNRLAAETGRYELDGVVSVIDVENWGGYASTSYTAKLQAKQTDVIVMNKWENVSETQYETCLDRLGDMDVGTPYLKSQRGRVDVDLLFGLDAKMARDWSDESRSQSHSHSQDHMGEMECLSVTLSSNERGVGVNMPKLELLLRSAPKDEVFRIKAILYTTAAPKASDGTTTAQGSDAPGKLSRYVLNWAFGRWTWSFTPSPDTEETVLRMSIFTAQYESNKWQKRLEAGQYIAVDRPHHGADLTIRRV